MVRRDMHIGPSAGLSGIQRVLEVVDQIAKELLKKWPDLRSKTSMRSPRHASCSTLTCARIAAGNSPMPTFCVLRVATARRARDLRND